MGTLTRRAIQRSIFLGFLGNIATRNDADIYHATYDCKVDDLPGVDDGGEQKATATSGRLGATKPKVAKWIMAVEISRSGPVLRPHLYAYRSAVSCSNWAYITVNLFSVLVLVKEHRYLYNLELEMRAVGFGKIDPVAATEIFIR